MPTQKIGFTGLIERKENNMDEYRQEVERLYGEHLYETEGRSISYGEIAYIEGLNKKELDELYKDLTERNEDE